MDGLLETGSERRVGPLMPRPPRIHLEGALYYVSCRAVENRALFRDAADYEAYLGLLDTYRSECGFKLFTYVLLPDQLHLCLELTNETTISTIMHAVSSRYTKYFNKRYGHSGHLFQERFKSTVLEKKPYLLSLTRYLHLLPMHLGVTPRIQDHRWSSLQWLLTDGHRAIEPNLAEEAAEILEALCEDQHGWTYAQYARSGTEQVWRQFEQLLQRQHVLGSAAFLGRAEQASSANAVSSEASGATGGSTDEGSGIGAPSEPRPQPAPMPMPRRWQSVVVMASLSLAFLSVCVAVFSVRGLESFKETVQALAQERTILFSQAGQPGVPVMQLSSMTSAPDLNGTVWQLRMRPIASMHGTATTEQTLEFHDGQLVARQADAIDAQASSYRLLPRPDGSVAWETVQTDASGAMLYWHGQISGQAMHGTVVRQSPGQSADTFEFVGSPQTMREI